MQTTSRKSTKKSAEKVAENLQQNSQTVNPMGQEFTTTNQVPLFDLLKNFEITNNLSEAGKEYIEKLQGFLKVNPDIKVVDVSNDNINAYVVFDKKHAIALLFSEGYNIAGEFVTPSIYLQNIIADFTAKYKGIKIIQDIVVHPVDYAKVDKMSMYLLRTFQSLNLMDATTDASIIRGGNFNIVTNTTRVKEFVNQISPHAVPARCDYGFMLTVTKENRVTGSFVAKTEDPIIAVTAYTDFYRFIDPSTGLVNKCQPAIHITDIVSKVPALHLATLLIPIMADVFIKSGYWAVPFKRFGTGDRNIGHLFPSSDGKKLYDVKNNEEFVKCVAEGFTEPIIVFDIPKGRARIAGIDTLGNEAAITNFVANFFKDQSFLNSRVVHTRYAEINGINRTENGSYLDMREYDYLALVKTISDKQSLERLLMLPQTPYFRIQTLKNWFPNIEPLYMNDNIIINAEFVRKFSNAFMSLGLTFNSDYAKPGLIPSAFAGAQFSVDQNYINTGATTMGIPNYYNSFGLYQ